ncbi:hypothetical protein RIF29_29965 [Crotalaria pallida]|uniref:Uncharacterized protein n=1 Tax=Crotalaria pallida TaxID=3830 RepID=A0AAN9EFG7_CROPI
MTEFLKHPAMGMKKALLGNFQINSLKGTFPSAKDGGDKHKMGQLFVTVVGEDGKTVIGGLVHGQLITASNCQMVALTIPPRKCKKSRCLNTKAKLKLPKPDSKTD